MTHKLGMFSWYGFNTPLKERLNNIKKIGFDTTMIWWGDKKAFEDLKPDQIIKTCNKIDLEIENIHVPFEDCNKIWYESKIGRKNIILKYKKWIEDCNKYNISMIVLHITKGNEIKESNIYGIESIKRLVEIAIKNNIKIALENTRNNNLLFEVFKNIDSENLGICFDSSHSWLYEKEENEILKKLSDKIFAVHFSDNDKIEDKHWLKDEGINNWEKMLKEFPKNNYNINISLEVYPKEDMNEIIFLEKAYKMAKEIRDIICNIK